MCAAFVVNAQAATFTVDSTLDLNDFVLNDGICDADPSPVIVVCTLRAAIQEANATPPADDDIINFSLPIPSTILLTLGEFPITSNITINGPGVASLTVSGNGANRVFNITSGVVNINNLTVTGGNAVTGAGININTANVTLENLIIRGNAATTGSGGGVAVNAGALTINNSIIGGTGAGQANTAAQFGGGIFASTSNVTITNSSIVGNTTGVSGGALLGGGIINISGSPFGNNTAVGNGGGVAIQSGTATITTTTVRDNTATTGIGGGVLINIGVSAVITNSTISVNNVEAGGLLGGGVYNGGTLQIANSTVTNNSAPSAGGVFNFDTITLTNVTVSNNPATNDGGGIVSQGTLNIRNTIVAQNTAPTNPDLSSSGVINTGGGNLIGNNAGAVASFPAGTPNANGDFVGTPAMPINPMLGLLQNNGGPTLTRAPSSNSPAVNNGNNCVVTVTCPLFNATMPLTTNQRGAGFPRQNSIAVDIGAVESPFVVAASVAVGGRVLSPSGRGVFRARVTLTDFEGNSRMALTNPFGYYHFDEVPVGQTYIFSVVSKSYIFAPQAVSVFEEINELNFYAQP